MKTDIEVLFAHNKIGSSQQMKATNDLDYKAEILHWYMNYLSALTEAERESTKPKPDSYEVSFYYEEQGRAIIQASSEKEALAKLEYKLETNGIDDFSYKVTHRDYGTTQAKQLGDI